MIRGILNLKKLYDNFSPDIASPPIAILRSKFHKPLRCNTVHGGNRRCISRRAAQIESLFELRKSSEYLSFEYAHLCTNHARGG